MIKLDINKLTLHRVTIYKIFKSRKNRHINFKHDGSDDAVQHIIANNRTFTKQQGSLYPLGLVADILMYEDVVVAVEAVRREMHMENGVQSYKYTETYLSKVVAELPTWKQARDEDDDIEEIYVTLNHIYWKETTIEGNSVVLDSKKEMFAQRLNTIRFDDMTYSMGTSLVHQTGWGIQVGDKFLSPPIWKNLPKSMAKENKDKELFNIIDDVYRVNLLFMLNAMKYTQDFVNFNDFNKMFMVTRNIINLNSVNLHKLSSSLKATYPIQRSVSDVSLWLLAVWHKHQADVHNSSRIGNIMAYLMSSGLVKSELTEMKGVFRKDKSADDIPSFSGTLEVPSNDEELFTDEEDDNVVALFG